MGSFVAGLLLTWISFPKQTELADVPAGAIHNLGVIGGPILMALYASSTVFILLYPITKSKYTDIRAQLEQANK